MTAKDVAYNQDIKCLTSKRANISNRYIFFALRSLEPNIVAMLETTGIGAGSARKVAHFGSWPSMER